MMKSCILLLSILINLSSARDFYMGMFKKNDFLVAQDTLYRERTPYRFTYAKYGRVFRCPITYCRVVDRLGIKGGPRVQINRGGLQKKYITLRIVSPYNTPISVNIYIGCANNIKPTTKKPTTLKPTTNHTSHAAESSATEHVTDGRDVTEQGDAGDDNTNETTISPEENGAGTVMNEENTTEQATDANE